MFETNKKKSNKNVSCVFRILILRIKSRSFKEHIVLVPSEDITVLVSLIPV